MSKKMGRPRKEIDFEEFKKLCRLYCTKTEVAGWFDVSLATLERRIKEWAKEHGVDDTFEALVKRYSAHTKVSLRRRQIEIALNSKKDNVSMLIWLGKQLLNQMDSPEPEGDQEEYELPESLTPNE